MGGGGAYYYYYYYYQSLLDSQPVMVEHSVDKPAIVTLETSWSIVSASYLVLPCLAVVCGCRNFLKRETQEVPDSLRRLASELRLGGFVGSIGFMPTDSKGARN